MFKLLLAWYRHRLADMSVPADLKTGLTRGPSPKSSPPSPQTATESPPTTPVLQEESLKLLHDMVELVHQNPQLVSEEHQEFVNGLYARTAKGEMPTQQDIVLLGNIVNGVVSRLQGDPLEQAIRSIQDKVVLVRGLHTHSEAMEHLADLHKQLKEKGQSLQAICKGMGIDPSEFQEHVKGLYREAEAELYQDLYEAQLALDEIEIQLTSPHLSEEEITSWLKQKQALEGIIDELNRKLDSIQEHRTGPVLNMTPEEAKQERNQSAAKAAQKFRNKHGFSPGEGSGRAGKKTDLPGAPAQTGTTPAAVSASPPPPVTPRISRTADTDSARFVRQIIQQLLQKSQIRRDEEADSLQKFVSEKRMQREAQMEKRLERKQMEERIHQWEEQKAELEEMADEAADQRLKAAGVRSQSLIEEISKQVHNEPGTEEGPPGSTGSKP